MKHAALIALAVLFVVLGTREASAKPKVAILGVEVTGPIDQAATGAAHDLTEGLRSKAKQGNGPFQLAPSSDRELIDEKVLKNCDSEGPLCMSDIGRDIGTDILIYGQLAKAGDGYTAKFFVLDVKQKSREKELTVRIPGGSSGDAVRAIAKKTYTDLVGAGPAPAAKRGTLTIEANVETGTVFVDDDQAETLRGGRATLQLAEGRYRIGVQAPGRRRKEIAVTITAGESTTEAFQLAEKGESGGKRASYWKPLFGASLGVAVVLGGISVVEWRGALTEFDSIKNGTFSAPRFGCAHDLMGATEGEEPAYKRGCDKYDIHVYTAVSGVVLGAAAVFTGYMAFVHQPAESVAKTSGTRSLRDRIAITPMLSPETQGAVLDLSW